MCDLKLHCKSPNVLISKAQGRWKNKNPLSRNENCHKILFSSEQNYPFNSNRALDQTLKRTLKNANTQLIAVFVEGVSVATNVVLSVLYLGVESTFVFEQQIFII